MQESYRALRVFYGAHNSNHIVFPQQAIDGLHRRVDDPNVHCLSYQQLNLCLLCGKDLSLSPSKSQLVYELW